MTPARSSPPPLFRTITLTDKDFKSVREIVYELAGINLHEGKRELVVARLSKRIRQLNMRNVGEYLSYVREQNTQEELVSMLDALSTNLTSFWRESQHFDYVAEHTIPWIVARTDRDKDWKVRLWSAGCSSGEEPYGLAMLLTHRLERPNRYDLKILATDLSTRVLGIAHNGVYTEERVKPVPPDIRRRFFHEVKTAWGKEYRVMDEVKALVSYARLNLMESWPMKGPMDFIFCRNVMIYFDKSTQARLVTRFFELLRPGGTLFIGHSESLTGIEHRFRYVRPTIYEKP
ncbi:protein-glutamate O-methyltransferase [bacterium]|nr:protein-glutamate O-methyltransferase [bacterium]MBU1984354.1 protein-glutamate O-methyltransferase [bacterium]